MAVAVLAVSILTGVIVWILSTLGIQAYTWQGVAAGLLAVVAGTVAAIWLITRYWTPRSRD